MSDLPARILPLNGQRSDENTQRLGRIDAPVVERATGDRPFENCCIRHFHADDVGDGGKAARSDHRDGDGFGQFDASTPS
jgi:hypothetical protein